MDLMILDVMMPGLDGFTVCKMAREMGGMPIILLTARAGEDDRLRGYGLGADDYKLILSISVDTFRARILGSKQPPQ